MNLSRAQMGVSYWIKYGGKCVWCVTFSYSMQSHNAESPLAHHPGRGRFLFQLELLSRQSYASLVKVWYAQCRQKESTKTKRIIVRFWCFQQMTRAGIEPTLTA